MRNFPGPGGIFFMPHLGGMILLALAAIALVIWLVKRCKHGHHPMGPMGHHHHPGWAPQPTQAQPAPMALQILDERLARGDIDVDDYLARRAALLGDRPNGTEFRPGPQPQEPQRATDPADGTSL